ncbi:MAG: PDZ domain-containing protein [Bacteroidales bacterium]|nr:PDZ domain-containing protein [Bacteroidales bacterium]
MKNRCKNGLLQKTSFLFVFILALPFQIFAQVESVNEHMSKVGQAFFIINQYYPDSIDTKEITDEMIRTLVGELDPHSSYVPAEEVQAQSEPLAGNFEGIGIEFTILRDTLVVVTPVAGGPSEWVGIQAEDRIVAVDGVAISSPELTNQKVFDLLRGPKGTRVLLTVVRKREKEPLQFQVVRDKIPIHSVDADYWAAPGIRYIKLNKFALTTQEEFIEAFRHLEEMPKGLILDLQGNGGGFMGAALFLAEQFLKKGQLILYTEGKNKRRQEIKASGMGFFINTPVVVLVDERSASASEIVAGALQDWDRGVIVGRRSFGKGLVQQLFPLNDGSELRLTVARYHTPSGRVIQSPYRMGEKEAYYRDFLERYEKGESFSRDSVHIPDSLVYRTLVEDRVVYGGGGILPDVFVPADTTYFSSFYLQLARNGIVTEFMNDYLDKERGYLSGLYKSFEDFDKQVPVALVPFEGLLEYAATQGIVPEEKDLEVSEYHIRMQIKALMASRLFGQEFFYRVINRVLPEYNKALEVINGLL